MDLLLGKIHCNSIRSVTAVESDLWQKIWDWDYQSEATESRPKSVSLAVSNHNPRNIPIENKVQFLHTKHDKNPILIIQLFCETP